MFNFSDKVIVVTGAAGNLGQAVVKAFLNSGGIVCGVDHRKGRLADAVNPSQMPGRLFIFEEMDVTHHDSVTALARRIGDEVGRVAVLVNTVGGFTMGEAVHELKAETWQKMMDLNVKSFLNTSSAFVPGMITGGGGKVVSIGAKASLQGGAKTGAYAAAKSAVLRLTESMAAELKSDHIQVNCVLPSTIDTKENRQAMPEADYSRWVSPEMIAEVVLFLCSPAANEITGAAIPVYGSS